MDNVRQTIERYAVAPAVLVVGSTGTGKELVASEIHKRGPWKDGPFVPINVSEFPESLIESRLFGHLKGAFTGAINDESGVIMAANGGVLFLDELQDLKPGLQTKLLRVLQKREVLAVGASSAMPVELTIVAAVNRSPEQLMEEGRLREDLFERLNRGRVELPALSERTEDIPLLAYHFLHLMKDRFKREHGFRFDEAALQALRSHAWERNVRELENVVERIVMRLGEAEAGEDGLIEITEAHLELPKKAHKGLSEAEQVSLVRSVWAAYAQSDLPPRAGKERWDWVLGRVRENFGEEYGSRLFPSAKTVYQKFRKAFKSLPDWPERLGAELAAENCRVVYDRVLRDILIGGETDGNKNRAKKVPENFLQLLSGREETPHRAAGPRGESHHRVAKPKLSPSLVSTEAPETEHASFQKYSAGEEQETRRAPDSEPSGEEREQLLMVRFLLDVLREKDRNYPRLIRTNFSPQDLEVLWEGKRPTSWDEARQRSFERALRDSLKQSIEGLDDDGSWSSFLEAARDEERIERCVVQLARNHNHIASTLSQRLSAYGRFLRMRAQWSDIFDRIPLLRSLPELDPDLATALLERLYVWANVNWTASETASFTQWHFEDMFWVGIVKTAQATLKKKKEYNHIHWANEMLGETLAQLLCDALMPGLWGVRGTLRILEGGVGGANTLHQLLVAVQQELIGRQQKDKRAERLLRDLIIRYQGYELNHWYIDGVQDLLYRGTSPALRPSAQTDPRVQFFREQADRLQPLDGKDLVKPIGMDWGVGELAADLSMHGTIDLFITSYAFHHLPNAVRLARFLRSGQPPRDVPDVDVDDMVTGMPASFCEMPEDEQFDFLNDMRRALEQAKRGVCCSDVQTPLARTVLSLLPIAREETQYPFAPALTLGELNEIELSIIARLRAMTTTSKTAREPWRADWVDSMLEDRQRRLLTDLYALLRPGGFLAIADPDGYSSFNRESIGKSPEMAVAYFRTRAELVNLVLDIGYEVVSEASQIGERNRDGVAAQDIVHTSRAGRRTEKELAGDARSDLGYIVIARKPLHHVLTGSFQPLAGKRHA